MGLGRVALGFGRSGAPSLLSSAPTAEPAAFAPFAVTRGQADVVMRLGAFGFRDTPAPWRASLDATVEKTAADSSSGQLVLALADGSEAELEVEVLAAGVVRLKLRAPAGLDRAAMSFVCAPDDQFLGLGAQTPAAHRGQIVPLWGQEQGVGKADAVDHYASYTPLGQTYDSYLPIPVLYNPRGYMLLVETTRRVLFDLCKTEPKRWRVEAWGRELSLVLVTGDTPLSMLERMTALTGRTTLPAPWVFGPWLDAIKGPAAVRAVAKAARDADIPASAIWTEDWAGGAGGAGGYHLTYQWSVDQTLYPDLKSLAGELHQQGFRFLGYFNTFIIEGTPEWDEAVAQKLLIEDGDGKTLTFLGPPRLEKTSLLDLSKPAARAWAKKKMKAALALGLDGWMADFAEWLPWEAKLADGRGGAVAHNDYPRQWQKLNQEFFAEARPGGDFAYFVRSGWTGTQALAPIVWAGDQNTTFDADDGLPTVVTLGLNLGLSGVTIYGHDIAGYTSIFNPPSAKELFFRWTQLGAFSPVMRTHHGSSGGEGWHFDKDAATRALFARYARAHVRLYPYLRGLAQQAASRGWPLWRPMILHYPAADPTIDDQFLLGDALLVAPVLKEGQREREVRLPRGRWYDYWTGKAINGGRTVKVAAPLETIPVFARAGAIVPLLPEGVQTFASGSGGALGSGGLVDLDAVRDTLVVLAYHGADGAFTLEDGTILGLAAGGPPPDAETDVRVGGQTLVACADASAVGCLRRDAKARTITVELDSKALEIVATRNGKQSFRFQAPFTRKTRLTLIVTY